MLENTIFPAAREVYHLLTGEQWEQADQLFDGYRSTWKSSNVDALLEHHQ